MSCVDVVNRVWAAWEARDLDEVVACMASNIVFDFSHYPRWPHETTYHGVDRAVQSLGQWMAWWTAYRQDLIGYEEHGDVVLAMVRHAGIRDGEHVDEHIALHFHVHGERITRWEPWEDLDAADAALTP